MSDSFRAVVARQADGKQSVAIETMAEQALPAGDVLVDVEYSSLNYKDGLALTGGNRILCNHPMVPGIDFAGRVRHSESKAFAAGDAVVLTGWGVGESHSGGFAERARVRSEWLAKLPPGMTTRQAMAIGTAGLTSMLCVLGLEEHGLRPGASVLVSGASGGVGSVAVKLLAARGFTVLALTGRPAEADYLRSLGANEIVDRSAFQQPGKPLAPERWDGAIDCVGGLVLANIIAGTRYGGAVAACGLAGGTDIPTTVFPFILRGVSLVGIDSVQCPLPRREKAWAELARSLGGKELDAAITEVPLDDVIALAPRIIAGQVRGRTVVKL